MKTLLRNLKQLRKAGRWDIDYHLEPEGIKGFPSELLQRVDTVADIATEKRDPTKDPEKSFEYIDIASVDVSTGAIISPQTLTGDEAPSRARKVVQAFDIIVSTCRPTRGAIAVVPEELHNQIASTAFSIVRAKPNINPYYLHYALRLDSTLEQLCKWSTGSSYPAILDDDVKKTLIPVPSEDIQDAIAQQVMEAFQQRDAKIRKANSDWNETLEVIKDSMSKNVEISYDPSSKRIKNVALSEVEKILSDLPTIEHDVSTRGRGSNKTDLFSGQEDYGRERAMLRVCQ